MPGGNGTGPMGMGAMTGRGAGYCAGYNTPGYMNPAPGRGFGMGLGRGRGFGMGFGRGFRAGRWPGVGVPAFSQPVYNQPAPTREQEVEVLKDQAEYFRNALDNLNKQIENLENKK